MLESFKVFYMKYICIRWLRNFSDSTKMHGATIRIQRYFTVMTGKLCPKFEPFNQYCLCQVCLRKTLTMPLTKYFYSYDSRALLGLDFLIVEVSRSHSAPHSVGLLRTSDQLVTETYTGQNTTFTLDRHLCPWKDSNP